MGQKRQEYKRKDSTIKEDGANINISTDTSSLIFNIRGTKSFLEFERILITIQTLMELFNNYIIN